MGGLLTLNLSWNLINNLVDILEKIKVKLPKLNDLDLRCNLFVEDEDQGKI